MTHPAISALHQFRILYPEIRYTWDLMQDQRIKRESDPDRWPGAVFVPFDRLKNDIVPSVDNVISALRGQRMTVETALDQSKKTVGGWMLGTWRMTLGIYRFDPDVYPALLESPVPNELPAETFERLPQWCVYVETPNLPADCSTCYNGIPIIGFWALLDWRVTDRPNPELCLTLYPHVENLDIKNMLFAPAATIVLRQGWDIAEALRFSYSNVGGLFDPIQAARIATQVRPLIDRCLSLLLWLCSDEPDLSNVHGEPVSVSNPAPRRVKKIDRLTPPAGPTVVHVASRIGGEIRESVRSHESDGAGIQRRKAHIRRAHWHGYWTGPRTGTREFKTRWQPPILVSGV